jgi:hypothetical protein
MVIAMGLLLFVKLPSPWPRVLEGMIILCGVALLLAQKPLRQALGVLRRPQRWFVGSLIGVILVTQVAGLKPQDTFPAVRWAMYTRQWPGQPTFYEFVGVREDGSEFVLPAYRAFRTQRRAIPWQAIRTWHKMRFAADDSSREQLEEKLRLLLTSLVRRSSEKDSAPGSKVRSVRLVECTMPRPSPGRELSTSRRNLAEITIE